MSSESPTLKVLPSEDVCHSIEAGILRITIARPEKRNPLSLGVLEGLRDTLVKHQQDDLRLAVITGAGEQAFASGGDLKELSAYREKHEAAAFSKHGKAALNAIRSFQVPVVARLNGLALGGGAELALACDLRFAASQARIGFIHGLLRIAPAWGGSHDLVRLVGPAKALMMMATASVLDSSSALEMGLLDAVCPAELEFNNWFEGWVETLAANPPQVMRAYKASLGRMRGRDENDATETDNFADVWVHEDHWSAVERLQRSKS